MAGYQKYTEAELFLFRQKDKRIMKQSIFSSLCSFYAGSKFENDIPVFWKKASELVKQLEEEYPTETELKTIREWQYETGWQSLMDYISDIWHFAGWGWKKKGKTYYISTAGWSGNEEIIAAMKANSMFWSMSWVQSRRGGHYIFKVN